jgi:hypothetical protein
MVSFDLESNNGMCIFSTRTVLVLPAKRVNVTIVVVKKNWPPAYSQSSIFALPDSDLNRCYADAVEAGCNTRLNISVYDFVPEYMNGNHKSASILSSDF